VVGGREILVGGTKKGNNGIRNTVQAALMAIYRFWCSSGMSQTVFGRWVFEAAYDLYKETVEARNIDALRQYVDEGKLVFDVGANTGFFTRRFAKWVGETGKVVAIEPEHLNFHRLSERLSRYGIGERVSCIRAVAAEKAGELMLNINPNHPGDHRIGLDGVPVSAVTLDGLAEKEEWKPVTFIKIDVQGAEMRVLKGCEEILSRFSPALFVELDEQALKAQGDSVSALLDFLTSRNYRAHQLEKDGCFKLIERDGVLNVVNQPDVYIDFLFLPDRKKTDGNGGEKVTEG